MKKIILLMLLAFSSTTLVYAVKHEYEALLDDKRAKYQNILDQMGNNLYSDIPDLELHAQHKKQLNEIKNEIKNIPRFDNLGLDVDLTDISTKFDNLDFIHTDISTRFDNLDLAVDLTDISTRYKMDLGFKIMYDYFRF